MCDKYFCLQSDICRAVTRVALTFCVPIQDMNDMFNRDNIIYMVIFKDERSELKLMKYIAQNLKNISFSSEITSKLFKESSNIPQFLSRNLYSLLLPLLEYDSDFNQSAYGFVI